MLALADLVRGDHAPAATTAKTAPSAGAWNAHVSFGALTVRRVERTAGTTHGAGHAIEGDRHDEVRVLLHLGNRRAQAVAFSPGQLRLRVDGSGATVPPLRPNPPPGSIAAAETVDQRLTFVVPARLHLLRPQLLRPRAARPLARDRARCSLAPPRKD